ncbi:MAG: hypothetical protein PSW75_02610 [bacterium]|nr:hypothetical protein [bacterium]MDI1334625.1 hypothetical protein [Lacunisphaera sp.]
MTSQIEERIRALPEPPSGVTTESFSRQMIHGKKAPAAEAARNQGTGLPPTRVLPASTAFSTKKSHKVAFNEARANT